MEGLRRLIFHFYHRQRGAGRFSPRLFRIRRNSCDPEEAMKIFLGVLALVLVAASLLADYKWRQWMAKRRRERE
jgi:hypothetical protein